MRRKKSRRLMQYWKLETTVLSDFTQRNNLFVGFPVSERCLFIRGNGQFKKSFSNAQSTCSKAVFVTVDNVGLTMLSNNKETRFVSLFKKHALN